MVLCKYLDEVLFYTPGYIFNAPYIGFYYGMPDRGMQNLSLGLRLLLSERIEQIPRELWLNVNHNFCKWIYLEYYITP